MLTLTDGKAVQLGQVVGKDGAPGRDGKDGEPGRDGLGFDDLDVDYDGVRSITMRMKRGDAVKEFQFQMPVMIYQGIFRAERIYDVGDTVTWSGSLWHCHERTSDKPGDKDSKGWQLVAKKGADGKNGARGERGDRGPPGANGKDLTIPMMGR